MFEGDMLLPNLEFNPDFEGKPDANLLSLEESVLENRRKMLERERQERSEEREEEEDTETRASEALLDSDSLLQLAQEKNWLHSRSFWVPRRIRDLDPKWEANSDPYFYESDSDGEQPAGRAPAYNGYYHSHPAGGAFY